VVIAYVVLVLLGLSLAVVGHRMARLHMRALGVYVAVVGAVVLALHLVFG